MCRPVWNAPFEWSVLMRLPWDMIWFWIGPHADYDKLLSHL